MSCSRISSQPRDQTPLPCIAGLPGGSDGKESSFNAGDSGSIPGLGRSPEEGNGNSLQYSCVENFMDRGAWWATVHGGAKSQTRLSDQHFHFHSCIAGRFLTIWTIREALRLIMAPTDLPQFSDPCLASPNPSISFSFPSLAHRQGPTTTLLTTL